MEQSRTQSFVFTLAVFGVFCASTAAQTVKENPSPAPVQGKVVSGSEKPIQGTNISDGKGKSRKDAGASEPPPPKVKNSNPAAVDQSGKSESVKEPSLVTRPQPPEPKVVTRNPVAPTPIVRKPSPSPATHADKPAANPAPQAGSATPAVDTPQPIEIRAMADAFLFAGPGKNIGPPTQVAEMTAGIHPISLWDPQRQAVHPIPLAETGKGKILPVKILPVQPANPDPSQP